MTEGSDTSSNPAPEGDALRVDFYVLDEASSSARLKLACKLVEKAYQASQKVLVWDTDAEELRHLDDLLWTYSDRTFVPHEALVACGEWEAPVALSSGTPLSSNIDIIINLAAEIPPWLPKTRRVAEIIDGDDARRRAGRARFKAYRELGLQPATYNIRADL